MWGETMDISSDDEKQNDKPSCSKRKRNLKDDGESAVKKFRPFHDSPIESQSEERDVLPGPSNEYGVSSGIRDTLHETIYQLELNDEDYKKNVTTGEWDESWLKKDIFPQDKTLALFAILAYEDDLHTTIFSTDKEIALLALLTYENKLYEDFISSNETLNQCEIQRYKTNLHENLTKLIQEWKLLITSPPNQKQSDGYFGAAFWNSKEQQLVISHRGTNSYKALVTDLEGPIRNQHTSQVDSACTFVAHVLHELSKVKSFKKIQISITGHTLGAWLAQITTFSTEYLTIDEDTNEFRVKGEDDIDYHVHTVGFESPGCRRMLTRLSEIYYPRYLCPDYIFWSNLDITLYFTRPNKVNTLCKHVGKLYQFDIPPFNEDNYSIIRKALDYVFKHLSLLHYHSIVNTVMALNSGTEIKVLHDWPLVTFPERTQNCSVFEKFLRTFLDFMSSDEREVRDYFASDNGDLKGIVNYEGSFEYGDEFDRLSCDSKTFSEIENMFLLCCHQVNSTQLKDHNDIIKEINNYLKLGLNLDQFSDIFKRIVFDKSAKNEYKTITCKSELEAKQFVNLIKQLFRFFHNDKEFVRKLSQISKANVLICNRFSDSYLQRITNNFLEFDDKIGLEMLLKLNKVILIKTEFNFEIQRIYSILHSNKLKYVFLDVVQLTHLNNCLHLSETFNSLTDHVLVLDYQQEGLKHKELEILNLLESIKMLKIIIVVNSDPVKTCLQDICTFTFTFVEHDSNPKLKDLKPESKHKLTNLIKEKYVLFQGKKIHLSTFINDESFEVLDSNVIAELMKEDKVIKIGSEPTKLCQLEAAYAKRSKFIALEQLISSFKINLNENKNELFLFTGVFVNESNAIDKLIQFLNISDKSDKQTIKVSTNVLQANYVNTNECNKFNIHVLKLEEETNEQLFRDFCYYNSDKLVYWFEIIDSKFQLLQIYDPHFYIKRNLNHLKIIKKEAVIDLFRRERFVFSGTNLNGIRQLLKNNFQNFNSNNQSDSNYESEQLENHFKQNIFATMNENDAMKTFDDWSSEFKYEAIHLLKVTDGKLIWQRSHSSITYSLLSRLGDYIDETLNKPIDEQALANLNEKVVIVVAEPGMGKSTTLTRLSECKLSDSWVIRLNLKDYLDDILKLPNYYKKTEYAIESVVNFLLTVSRDNDKSAFTSTLLKYSLSHQTSRPLLILFDGYDEIREDCQLNLIMLIKFLKEKTKAKLWITSRKHFTKQLEKNLGVFSVTFKELSLEERQKYLKNFWQVRLKLELTDTEYKLAFESEVGTNKFQVFSKALLEKADEVLDEQMSRFMGIPLQLRLLAEGFLPEFVKYIKSESEYEIPQFDNFNVSEIYQQFIRVKYFIYYQEKTALSVGLNEESDTLFSNLNKLHQRLALKLLFPNRIRYLVNIKSPFLNKAYSINPKDEIKLKRVGLVHFNLYSDQLEFIHRTFAEYFVAGLIINWLRKPIFSQKFKAVEHLLQVILKNHPVICTFLNEQISESDLAVAKIGSFSSDILESLMKYSIIKHVNLVKLILSFFKNKIWLLNENFIFNFLKSDLVNVEYTEVVSYFFKLINRYDLISKTLIIRHCTFDKTCNKYKISNEAWGLLELKTKCSILMNTIKYYPEIFKQVASFYYLEDLIELFDGDAELLQLLNILKNNEAKNTDPIHMKVVEINKVFNSLRDKNYKDIKKLQMYDMGDLTHDRQILNDIESLMSKKKPREVIKDRDLKQLHYLKMNLDCISLSNSSNDDTSKFLRKLKDDEGYSRLVNLTIELRDMETELDTDSLFDCVVNGKNENAKKLLKPYEKVNNVRLWFDCFHYEVKQLLENEISAHQKKILVFVCDWFKNDPVIILRLFTYILPTHPKYLETLLESVECKKTKELMNNLLGLFKDLKVTLTDEKLKQLGQSLLESIKDKEINTLRDILDILDNSEQNVQVIKFIKHEIKINKRLLNKESNLDLNILKEFLELLAQHGERALSEALKNNGVKCLLGMMSCGEYFPVLIHYLLLECSNLYSIFDLCKTEEERYSIWEFMSNVFPKTVACFTMMQDIHLRTSFQHAIEHNETNILNLLFNIMRPYPTILGQLIASPSEEHKSCLHDAILENKASTLNLFLAKLSKNVDAMKYVVEHFVSDEKDKLNLYEAAVINNHSDSLVIFLNSLKFNKDLLKNFVLPVDKSVKPAFYLAAERGCKEVVDTLLSGLESEGEVLWQLVTWSDPGSGKTVLHRAAERGYAEIVDALFTSLKSDPDKTKLKTLFLMEDNSGHTALDCAILSEKQIIRNDFSIELRERLIADEVYLGFQAKMSAKKSFKNQIKNFESLALSLCNMPMVVKLVLIMAKSFNNVKLMLAIFENEDLKLTLEDMYISIEDYSYDLFNCAIERDNLDLIKLLIEKGLDVNATNDFGLTPLMSAVIKNKFKTAKLLIKLEANVYAKDMNGKSAISYANDIEDKWKMIELLTN